MREFDLVVFGATGFTGKFVAKELYRLQSEKKRSLKWVAAGRSETKVRTCLEELEISGVDVIVADVGDQDSLDSLCARASVLINCVGPYQRYGEPVVKACISQKCDYVDITGETYFMELMLAKYGDQAREAGVYIVSACGFDCIPNDLGALLLQRNFSGELVYAESYMATSGSGFHLGTWESFLLSIRNHGKLSKFRKERNEAALPFPSARPPKRRSLFYSDIAHKWCVPFPGPDRAVVYRSMRYRHETQGTSPYAFKTYFAIASLLEALGMAVFFLVLLALVSTNFGFKLLLKFPGFFSGGAASKSGPSKEDLEKATFTVTVKGTGYSDPSDKSKPQTVTVKVRGVEPGYVATSAMMVQSALCLLEEKDSLPPSGGIYTPAVAFGDTKLIQNLENTGKVKFEVVQN